MLHSGSLPLPDFVTWLRPPLCLSSVWGQCFYKLRSALAGALFCCLPAVRTSQDCPAKISLFQGSERCREISSAFRP